MKEYNALQEFVDCALNLKPIIIYGDGRHKREWLHPQDVARAFHKALGYFEDMAAPYDVFILGSGEPMSIRRLAQLVIGVTGRPTQVLFRDKHTAFFDQVTNTSKARKRLDWAPLISTREIVSRVVEWRSIKHFYIGMEAFCLHERWD